MPARNLEEFVEQSSRSPQADFEDSLNLSLLGLLENFGDLVPRELA